jgi:hypothetical protein
MELISVLLIAISFILITGVVAILHILKHIAFIDLFIFNEWMKYTDQLDDYEDVCKDCQHE